MANPTLIIDQLRADSNPLSLLSKQVSNPPFIASTKQIAPALLSLESELRAHEDHLAHQFMGRVEAIERTQELAPYRYGFIPLGHALRMMTHYDVEDFPTANETYDRWANKGTFLEGKMYANFNLGTIIVTAYFAQTMSVHQSCWEGLTYSQMGTYPYLNQDCVILAEDEAEADFETSALPSTTYPCEDCFTPTQFGVMCSECEDALLSAFEPQS